MSETNVGISYKTRDKLLILKKDLNIPYISTYWAVIEYLINYYQENEKKKKI